LAQQTWEKKPEPPPDSGAQIYALRRKTPSADNPCGETEPSDWYRPRFRVVEWSVKDLLRWFDSREALPLPKHERGEPVFGYIFR
jgi:hypothetical protein